MCVKALVWHLWMSVAMWHCLQVKFKHLSWHFDPWTLKLTLHLYLITLHSSGKYSHNSVTFTLYPLSQLFVHLRICKEWSSSERIFKMMPFTLSIRVSWFAYCPGVSCILHLTMSFTVLHFSNSRPTGYAKFWWTLHLISWGWVRKQLISLWTLVCSSVNWE